MVIPIFQMRIRNREVTLLAQSHPVKQESNSGVTGLTAPQEKARRGRL